jgi:hypothetical protein
MKHYVKLLALFFGSLAAVPLLTGLVAAFSAGFGFLLFVLALPVAAGILLAGTVVLLIYGVREARELSGWRGRILSTIASPALCILTTLAALPLLAIGGRLGDLARLGLNHRHYEAIIRNAAAKPDPEPYVEDGGVRYTVDLGPPVRVAFNPEGLLDNWSGIIFDPTGDVMKAHGFDTSGKFYAPDRITKLFGGDLVGCRHLWRDYYKCSFT